MISAQTRFAFVARENRYTLFRIMLQTTLSRFNSAISSLEKPNSASTPSGLLAEFGRTGRHLAGGFRN